MTELEIERQFHGHDMAEVKGIHRNLLVEQLEPLIRDAKDCILIDEPEIAVRRLRAALALILRNTSP
jgi:hypothetical protein